MEYIKPKLQNSYSLKSFPQGCAAQISLVPKGSNQCWNCAMCWLGYILLSAERCEVIQMPQLWYAFTVLILHIILSMLLQLVNFTQFFWFPFWKSRSNFAGNGLILVFRIFSWFTSTIHNYFCPNTVNGDRFWPNLCNMFFSDRVKFLPTLISSLTHF